MISSVIQLGRESQSGNSTNFRLLFPTFFNTAFISSMIVYTYTGQRVSCSVHCLFSQHSTNVYTYVYTNVLYTHRYYFICQSS